MPCITVTGKSLRCCSCGSSSAVTCGSSPLGLKLRYGCQHVESVSDIMCNVHTLNLSNAAMVVIRQVDITIRQVRSLQLTEAVSMLTPAARGSCTVSLCGRLQLLDFKGTAVPRYTSGRHQWCCPHMLQGPSSCYITDHKLPNSMPNQLNYAGTSVTSSRQSKLRCMQLSLLDICYHMQQAEMLMVGAWLSQSS